MNPDTEKRQQQHKHCPATTAAETLTSIITIVIIVVPLMIVIVCATIITVIVVALSFLALALALRQRAVRAVLALTLNTRDSVPEARLAGLALKMKVCFDDRDMETQANGTGTTNGPCCAPAGEQLFQLGAAFPPGIPSRCRDCVQLEQQTG